MKPSLLNLVPLAIAGALLAGPAFAADVAVVSKSVKPVAQERSGEAGTPKQKPAAGSEVARKDVKVDGAGKTAQLEVPVKLVLAAD
jgi:hypothetical protein